MSIVKFVESIQPKSTDKLIVMLDSKIYPSEYGISVRPIQVTDGTRVIDMKQLIDTFGKVPYITVRESKYRTVYRDPMLMTIDLKPKVYEEHTYYDYRIDKLCLRSELKKYESIYSTAHAAIKEFKETNEQTGDCICQHHKPTALTNSMTHHKYFSQPNWSLQNVYFHSLRWVTHIYIF